MFRIVAVTLLGVMLFAVVSGSAAKLEVNGGTIQVFHLDVDIRPPGPEIPAACAGPGWSGSTIIHMTADMNPFYAGNGKHIIFGTPGNDTIYGGNGKDCILGLGGDDSIFGGNGPDHIDGGSGFDTCDGGLGPNTIVSCESDGEESFAAGPAVEQAPEPSLAILTEPDEDEGPGESQDEDRSYLDDPEPTESAPENVSVGPRLLSPDAKATAPRPTATPAPIGISIPKKK